MGSLSHLNKYLFKYKWLLLLGVLFTAISNLFAIYPAQLIRYAFDLVLDNIHAYRMFQGFAYQSIFYQNIAYLLLLFGALVLLLAFIKGVFMFFMRQTIIVMSRHIEFDLKNEVYQHYQKLDLAFYKRNNTGDLMNRISEDVSRVRMYAGPAIMYSINLIVLFVLVVATMFSINPTLSWYVLTPLPFLSVTIYYVSNIINKKSEQVQSQLSTLSSLSQEGFSGIRVLSAYNKLGLKERVFDKESIEYKDRALSLAKVDAFFQPMMILLIGLSTILTIFIGGKLALAGEITNGTIAEFVIYINMLTWPVAAVGWVTSIVQRAAASQKRINEFLNTEPSIKNPTNQSMELKGDIVFDKLSFQYTESGTVALDSISFTLKAGESLAILGKTGSGKSTIANLICRLYDVSSGSVYIDGKDIREWNLDDLRRNIGYVPQEVLLFSDTIANNIAFGLNKEEFDMEDVIQAAKDAEVYHNIMEFPKAFETRVGERGITLSGGQKQRVSIARAIIRKPSILIFDDCLSAVDTETEEKINTNLKRIMKGKTSIMISHRVFSVKHCDKILLLENNKMLEFGSHETLMKEKGAYYQLYQKQLLEGDKIPMSMED